MTRLVAALAVCAAAVSILNVILNYINGDYDGAIAWLAMSYINLTIFDEKVELLKARGEWE